MKLDLKELIAKLTNTPIVVDEGTSGDWHYRVWSNGYCELDCCETVSITFTNWGNLSYQGVNLPVLPFAIGDQYSTSVSAFSGTVSCWGSLMNNGSIRVYSQSGAGGPHTVTVSRHISCIKA